MAFNFSSQSVPLLNSEQAGAMPDMIAKMMQSYTKQQHAKYLPQQIQAEIFNKEIGPLATLASSPNFTGFNPETQKMIAERIRHHLGGQGASPEGSTAGYASDKNIYDRLSHGASESFGAGKRSEVGRSKLVNLLEQFGLSPEISKQLGGTGASQEKVKFDQAIEEGIHQLKLKGYSEPQARHLLERIPGENDKTYKERIKPLFLSDNSEQESTEPNANEVPETTTPKGAEMLLIGPDGSKGWVPADKANELISSGKFKEAKL